jgi:hypothetical protein
MNASGRIPRLLAAAAVLTNLTTTAWSAPIPVEVELVLAIDSSSSIEPEQFDLQIEGYVQAFRHPAVIAAIQALQPNGIAVTMVQWSASFQQTQTVEWTLVNDTSSAASFAADVESNMRQFTGFGTALGTAISYSAGLFEQSPFEGQRRVIDVLADERANTGAHPSYAREEAILVGATVNGLAMVQRDQDLVRYFEHFVITGPDAFVIAVQSYEDLAESIRRKLIRELTGPLAQSEPPEEQKELAFQDALADPYAPLE